MAERSGMSGRFSTTFRQFIMFGIVGGSGTVVNLLVVYLTKKISGWGWGISEHDAFLNLLGSSFHIRWYHVFATIAFLVANTWNYQLNRSWTFRGYPRRSWWRGFFPFLLTGIGAFVVSQIVLTLLMNPTSPLTLPVDIFDDSTGLRTKFYWASAISIIVAMPVNFMINKLWAFRGSSKKLEIVVEQEPVARA
ncbi:GtrA family protein [Corynebacterium testudinoris]|uniref:Putative membrane protein n=1 Tax=Corynebacterium testudinoris TaxID=136857 RepID=A0A0G3H969_9CORY|nr:GtrA family protein [Corynebacterium testudinoris]AKK08413.1 putative membrane protein [Corynebacterium testudinoris]MBX8994625.1 GtrA family protein [Corynebacterium testudinoris]